MNTIEKKNNRRTFRKIFFILIVVFAVALIFNAVMFIIGIKTHHFQRWAKEQYFGEIIEIKDNEFLVQGRDSEKRAVFITEKTIIKKGPEAVHDRLKVGEKVMILGPIDSEGRINAQLIRIFDPNDPMDKIPKF